MCSIESMAEVPPSTIPRESRTFCLLRHKQCICMGGEENHYVLLLIIFENV